MLHRTITRWINIHNCIRPNLIRRWSLTNWIARVARDRHDKRRATNHVYTHYCDVMFRHFQFDIMPLLFNRIVVVRRVWVRWVSVTAVADVRMYNESRYRLTNVINMINIPSGCCFSSARSNRTPTLVLFSTDISRRLPTHGSQCVRRCCVHYSSSRI